MLLPQCASSELFTHFPEHQDDGYARSSSTDNAPSKLAALEEIEGDVDGHKCGIQECGIILRTALELVHTDDDCYHHMDCVMNFVALCSNSSQYDCDWIIIAEVSFINFFPNSMRDVTSLLLG